MRVCKFAIYSYHHSLCQLMSKLIQHQSRLCSVTHDVRISCMHLGLLSIQLTVAELI